LERKRLSVEDDAVDFVDVRDNGVTDDKVDTVAGVDALDIVDLCNVGHFLGVWNESSSSCLEGCEDKFWLFFLLCPDFVPSHG